MPTKFIFCFLVFFQLSQGTRSSSTVGKLKVLQHLLQGLNLKEPVELKRQQIEMVELARMNLKKKFNATDQELDSLYSQGYDLAQLMNKPTKSHFVGRSSQYPGSHSNKPEIIQPVETFFLKAKRVQTRTHWSYNSFKPALKFNRMSRKILINISDVMDEESLVDRVKSANFYLNIKVKDASLNAGEKLCVLAYNISSGRVDLKADKALAYRNYNLKVANPDEFQNNLMHFHADNPFQDILGELWYDKSAILKLAVLVIKRNGINCALHANRPLSKIIPVNFEIQDINTPLIDSFNSRNVQITLTESTDSARHSRSINYRSIKEASRKIRQSQSQLSQTQRRKRRSACNDLRECCTEVLRIDFSELGWDYIVVPKSFNANTCSGRCSAENTAVYNPKLINTVEMCCVPTRMKSMTILYMTPSENLALRSISDLITESCGCR